MAANVKKVTEGYSRSYKLDRKAKRLQSKSTKLLQNICLFVRLFFDKGFFFITAIFKVPLTSFCYKKNFTKAAQLHSFLLFTSSSLLFEEDRRLGLRSVQFNYTCTGKLLLRCDDRMHGDYNNMEQNSCQLFFVSRLN